MKITNEMVKEHLVCLSFNDTLNEKVTHADPGSKSALTRQYNKTHQSITKIVKQKKKDEDAEESSDGAQSEDDGGQLLDEV